MVNYISPSRTIKIRVHTFLGTYIETRQDFAHIIPNFPFPCFKISSSTPWSGLSPNPPKFSILFQGDLRYPVWQQTNTSNKNSNPFFGEFTKCWPGHKPVTKIFRPLSRRKPSQNLVWLLPVLKISIFSILGKFHRTLPISATFPNIEPVPQT